MHLHGSGEANRFPRSPLDPRTKRERLTLEQLGLPVAREGLRRFQLLRIRAPVSSVAMFNHKRLQEPFQLPQHCIIAPAKHIRQNYTAVMVAGMPRPPWRALLPYKAPHCVDLSRCDSLYNHVFLPKTES
jgi:hypothetical protein